MKETKIRAAPRLQFSEEELEVEGLKKPVLQVEKSAEKKDRMKARLRKEHGPKKREADAPRTDAAKADISKATSAAKQTSPVAAEKPILHRLHFEEDTAMPVPHKPSKGVVKRTVSAEVHKQIAQDEDENTGLQALHTTEQTGESAIQAVQQMRQSKLQHDHSRMVKAEKKLDHANIRYLQKEHEIRHPEVSGSNPISRAYQRRAIRKEYMAAKAGKSTGSAYASSTAAKKAVRRTGDTAEKTVTAIFRKKHYLLLLGLAAMLLFVMNAISSCTPLVEAGLHAFVMGTYPAEESDVKAAERAYKTKEDELKRELERYERYQPGYDEYIVEADTSKIWHDPYALISIISAYHGGEEWTIDDVHGTIEMLFGWQYKVTETTTTETRYRTEEREDSRLVTDPDTGQSYWERYTYEVSVPYSYSICTVTLEAENLSHAPVYIMSREKMGLYALYMSTLGNMPDLFAGNPYASELKEPLRYDVPQELLDADPQFALLVEAANSCLGFPYVWGGYDPSTSFDCSGFISWVFTSTGVNNIGHMGATSLYGYSDPIRPEDARPGDVIFFQGTMGDDVDGITHCGLYVGNNMMIHCGNPCSYADLTDSYWQQHFYGYGRLYN